MPLLTRWFIKAALIYLILALCVGILLVLPGDFPTSSIFPSYLHMLTFGWLTQLIFGVALWMFPKYSLAQPRGLEWLGWTAFVSLNAGLILRIIFEPLNSLSPSPLNSWMLVLAALLQWSAGISFVSNTWNRVKEKQVPHLSVYFVRASLIYLVLGFTAGALLLINKGMMISAMIWMLLPIHIEFTFIGWMIQLALGVAFWILPRFSSGPSRGDERWSWAAFVLLNIGIFCIVVQSLFHASWISLLGRIFEVLALSSFVIGNWKRVKPMNRS